MRLSFLMRFIPPAGPVLIVLLIGLVLLNGLLYYRSVKIQRFLEPALALSQPRNEFSKRILQKFRQEFGDGEIPGIQVKGGTIILHQSLLFAKDNTMQPRGQAVTRKLAMVFLALLKDGRTRSEVGHILIRTHAPSLDAQRRNISQRINMQLMAGFIQESLFRAEPELGAYAPYFMAGMQSLTSSESHGDVIEFIIVPSEFLHIELLEKLEKYAD